MPSDKNPDLAPHDWIYPQKRVETGVVCDRYNRDDQPFSLTYLNGWSSRLQLLAEERVDNRLLRISIGIVSVTWIGVKPLLSRANRLEYRIARLWWANIIIQPNVDDDRAGVLVGKVDAVVIAPRLGHRRL
jgi:hypothetical protein